MRGIVISILLVLLATTLVSAQVLIVKTQMTPEQFQKASSEPGFYLKLGNWLYAQGKLEAARSAYEKGLEGKQDPIILHNLGKIAYDLGDYSLARERFNQAIETSKDYGPAYYALGVLSMKEEKYSEASSWFEKNLVYDQSADAHCQLGNALAFDARYNGAKTLTRASAEYQTCVTLAPEWKEARANLEVLERIQADS